MIIAFDDGPLDLVRRMDSAELDDAMQRYRHAGHGFRQARYRELQRVIARQLERNIEQETSR